MSSTASRGPTTATERALSPDLARGFMLLFIAVANTVWYLWAFPMEWNAHPDGGSALDRAVQFVIITVVDMRAYPMFAFLFGYGMVQLLRRQLAAGTGEREARALLRRRNLWLVVFGLVHAALLFMGDILGAYGVAGLLLGMLFLRRQNATLLLWGALLTGFLAMLAAVSVLGMLFTPADAEADAFLAVAAASIAQESYLASVGERLLFWPVLVPVQGLLSLSVPIAILLGFWAARQRILEEPERHLALLRTVAAGGIAVAWAGGLPSALGHVGVLGLGPAQMTMLQAPHMLTGLAGGLGYIALITLVSRRLRDRSGGGYGWATTAVAATGRRSLTCYLAQSILCAPLLAAWGLGLGGVMHSSTMLLFAVGVWLATVLFAYALERAGRRGPFEVLLRRLAYRRPNG